MLTGCEGTEAAFAGIVAAPEGGEFTVVVGVRMVGEADFEALGTIMATVTLSP